MIDSSWDDPDLQEPELQVLRKGFAKVLSLAQVEMGNTVVRPRAFLIRRFRIVQRGRC